MSETDVAPVGLEVGIAWEHGRDHRVCDGALGTECRRKPLETLNSGAGCADPTPLAGEGWSGQAGRPTQT